MNRNMKKYKKSYTQEDVFNALEQIDKGMSLRQASATFQVPVSTLFTKQKCLVPVECAKGPRSYLTVEEEKMIVEWIFYCNDRGFPVTKNILLNCVQKLIKKLGRETPFKDGRPGRHWWEGFRRRNPEVSARVAQNLSSNRASATESVLKNWFEQVHEHLRKLSLLDIHPSRVYSSDESAFFFVPEGDRVLARRGSHSVYKVVHGDEKESITVLFTVNAEGTMLPPFILFGYERIPAVITRSLPPGWIIGNTDRGWMTGESFYQYITTKFHPWLIKNEIQLPVVLFVDGHVSHKTLALSKFCKTNGIQLIALYPNATYILQPLDVAVFHPLKIKWKNVIDNWRIKNDAQKFRRENFAPLLKKTLDSIPNLFNIIKNRFRTCGLCPFDSSAVDFNILNKKKKIGAQCQESQEGKPKDNNEDVNKCHLNHLESTLSQEDLQDFKNAVSSGRYQVTNSSNDGLFRYWLQLKGPINNFMDNN